MSDRRLIAVELTDKHIDIIKRAIGDRNDEDYWDVAEHVAEGIMDLIEQMGEML